MLTLYLRPCSALISAMCVCECGTCVCECGTRLPATAFGVSSACSSAKKTTINYHRKHDRQLKMKFLSLSLHVFLSAPPLPYLFFLNVLPRERV